MLKVLGTLALISSTTQAWSTNLRSDGSTPYELKQHRDGSVHLFEPSQYQKALVLGAVAPSGSRVFKVHGNTDITGFLTVEKGLLLNDGGAGGADKFTIQDKDGATTLNVVNIEGDASVPSAKLSLGDGEANEIKMEMGAAISDTGFYSCSICNEDTPVDFADASGNGVRAATEGMLKFQIDSVSSDSTSLELRVSNEEDTRAAADASLSTRVSDEEDARASHDSSLSLRVSNEEDTRAADDASLSTRVSDEEDARASHDASLSERVSIEEIARNDADVSLTTRVSNEEDARTADVASIDTALAAEASTRAADDASLSTRVSNEEDTRAADDVSLTTRVSDEEDARTSADASLSLRVSNEEDARDSHDTSLSLRVSNEEDARDSHDTSLSLRVSNEEDERLAKDTSLETRLDAEQASDEDNLEFMLKVLYNTLGLDYQTAYNAAPNSWQNAYAADASKFGGIMVEDQEVGPSLTARVDLA